MRLKQYVSTRFVQLESEYKLILSPEVKGDNVNVGFASIPGDDPGLERVSVVISEIGVC